MAHEIEQRRPSAERALDDLVTHSRQLVVNRFDLLLLEIKEGVAQAGSRVLEVVLSILLGFIGFVLVTGGITCLVAERISWPYACLTVGGVYVLVAAGLAYLGGRERPDSASGAN